MKAHKAKMKRHEDPKGQKLQNAAGRGADKICLNFIRKRAVFGNLWGGHHVAARQAKNEGMKAQKNKMKRNESPKDQNERK